MLELGNGWGAAGEPKVWDNLAVHNTSEFISFHLLHEADAATQYSIEARRFRTWGMLKKC
eukprot:1158488-Pelagomonas_calceolata.AAC.8